MEQLLCHLIGDYLLQSDWMAQEKRRSMRALVSHCLLYTLCFVPWMLWSGQVDFPALAVILLTHAYIDGLGLARYVVWAKNHLAPLSKKRYSGKRRYAPFSDCQPTGYLCSRPEYLTVWLLIIADNTLHLLCNWLALRFL